MDEFEHLLDKVFDSKEVQETEKRFVYETRQRTPNCLEWQWIPPTERKTNGDYKLVQVLKEIDPRLLQDSGIAEYIQQISTLLSHSRKRMGRPLHCDTDGHYLHLLLLKRLSHLFHNGHILYESPFESRVSDCHLFEYINSLLVSVAVFYTRATGMEDTPEKIGLFQQSAALLHEVLQFTAFIQDEKFEARVQQRWHYKRSPTAISNKTPSTTLAEPWHFIVDYIRTELGGTHHLNAYYQLVRIKEVETRARISEQQIKADLATYNEIIVDRWAPLTALITKLYSDLNAHFGQTEHAMANYASHMTHYWRTHEQHLLAQSDYAIYQRGESSNSRAYLLRAKARLEWLGELHENEASAIQDLYNEMTLAIQNDTYPMCDPLPLTLPVKAATFPENKQLFKDYTKAAWARFSDAKTIDEAFQAVTRLKESGPSVVQELREIVKIDLTNAQISAVCDDRKAWFAWLLERVNEDGEIHLTVNDVNLLREEARDLMESMSFNKHLL